MTRQLTPIEMMIDNACGFDPNAPRPPKPLAKTVDAALVNVANAAIAWLDEPSLPKAEELSRHAKHLRSLGW